MHDKEVGKAQRKSCISAKVICLYPLCPPQQRIEETPYREGLPGEQVLGIKHRSDGADDDVCGDQHQPCREQQLPRWHATDGQAHHHYHWGSQREQTWGGWECPLGSLSNRGEETN